MSVVAYPSTGAGTVDRRDRKIRRDITRVAGRAPVTPS